VGAVVVGGPVMVVGGVGDPAGVASGVGDASPAVVNASASRTPTTLTV